MSDLERRVADAIRHKRSWPAEDVARAALKAIAEGGYAIFDKSCLGSPPAQQEDQPNE